jgi:hypothetical protein
MHDTLAAAISCCLASPLGFTATRDKTMTCDHMCTLACSSETSLVIRSSEEEETANGLTMHIPLVHMNPYHQKIP